MTQKDTGSIMEHFRILPDPRRANHNTKQHNLIDIIVITVLAVICGADNWVDIAAYGEEKKSWLKTFLELPSGIPSHDTFGRVFALLDPEVFQQCFFAWVKSVSKTSNGKIVAIDGKSARRSHGKNQKPLHLISAFAVANGIVLGQRKVDGKSNEITAIPELLKTLMLKGCIVTADAMATQGWIVRKIRENKADYLLTVKANQKRLQQDIAGIIENDKDVDYYRSSESSHGREDVRECWVSRDITSIRDIDKWVDLQSVVRVTHTRTTDDNTSTETRHYITSLDANAKQALQAVREHWAIENKLHWSLDVSFREDESRAHIGHAQENLALVRKLALTLLRQDTTTKGGIKNRRLKAGWSNEYLLRILGVTG